MFGFPVGLYDNGNTMQGFSPAQGNNSGFPQSNFKEVYYTIKDGNWNDLTIWQTASGRIGNFPGINDDVYIRHTVTATTTQVTTIINNLFISGTFTMNHIYPQQFIVSGNLQCIGTLNTGSQAMILKGINNYINNYTSGALNIQYSRDDNISQPILPLNYGALQLGGKSPKYFTGDTTCVTSGFAQVDILAPNSSLGIVDFRYYNITIGISGTTIFNSTSCILLSNGANIIFTGGIIGFNTLAYFSLVNSTIEFRNGFAFTTNSNNSTFSGSIINFTTNSQTITSIYSAGLPHILDAAQVNIVGNITLTVATNDLTLSTCPINGTTSSSKLLMGASGLLNFSTAASVNSMTTGIWDFTTNANTIQYGGNYSATIPSYFTNFSSLTISGTGTKTLGANTTLSGNLSVTTNGNLELSTYNFTVGGTSTLSNGTSTIYPLSKSGSGNVIFVGLITSGNNTWTLDFSGGNPNVELRGGMNLTNQQTSSSIKTGTGTWNFTTNNQSILNNSGGNSAVYFNGPIIIGSGITLTFVDSIITNNKLNIVVNNLSGITGANGTSTLVNYSSIILLINAPLMTTGIFNPAAQSTSYICYAFNGDITLPYTSYAGLQIGVANSLFSINVTGTKILSGNTTVNNNLLTNVTGNGNLQLSTYNFTVNGTTTLNPVSSTAGYASVMKSDSGNVLFVGLITISNGSGNYLDFSIGNPNVELRGGILHTNIAVSSSIKTGTGIWSFTTNNQIINATNIPSTSNLIFDCPVSIASGITLSLQYYTAVIGNHITFNNTINGASSTSTLTLLSQTKFNYESSTRPMITGVLNSSTTGTTTIYGNGNQDILGGPSTAAKQVYANLTLNGGGTKTLQGYVSVLNTYTLTSPATLALNGYTLTNP